MLATTQFILGISHRYPTLRSMLVVIGLIAGILGRAQEPLYGDSLLFKNKGKEYQQWMDYQGLGEYLTVYDVQVSASMISLKVTASTNLNDCDILSDLWKELKERYRASVGGSKLLQDRLLERWAFQCSVPTNQTEIIISCELERSDYIRIFADEEGRVRYEDHTKQIQGKVEFAIPQSVSIGKSGQNVDSLNRDASLRDLLDATANFIHTFYYREGKEIQENVNIDTTRSFYKRQTWEFIQLKRKVISARNYNEYHHIEVMLIDQGHYFEVSCEFKGKYASGISRPPRTTREYEDMESNGYLEYVVTYQNKLFNLLKVHLENVGH